MWLINTIKTPSRHFPLSLLHWHNAVMDDDVAVATLEEQQMRIEKELKRRKIAASRTRKEEEERQLITAGEGELANSNIQPTRCLHVLTF
jgi:hypothetical protein